MARPPEQPVRSAIAADELHAYDSVVERQRAMAGVAAGAPDEHFDVGPYWGPLLTSPPLCALAAQMGVFVRTAGERSDSYSHADRELVDQVLSADMKTNVVQRFHIPDAVAVGVRIEAIEALRAGREELLQDDERLLARYIRQVVGGTVDNETWQAIEARIGERGTVEYTGFILWLHWIIRMMQAIGMAEPTDAEVDELIEGIKSGAVDVPDFRDHIR